MVPDRGVRTALPAPRGAHSLATQKAGGVMKVNLDCLPEELRQRRQWVVWKLEERDG